MSRHTHHTIYDHTRGFNLLNGVPYYGEVPLWLINVATLGFNHFWGDFFPSGATQNDATAATRGLIKTWTAQNPQGFNEYWLLDKLNSLTKNHKAATYMELIIAALIYFGVGRTVLGYKIAWIISFVISLFTVGFTSLYGLHGYSGNLWSDIFLLVLPLAFVVACVSPICQFVLRLLRK